MKKTGALTLVFLLLAMAPVQALSWAYEFVSWDGNVYEVLDEPIKEDSIGKTIGEVKAEPDDMTGDFYGNASNAYPIGTKYFEIIGMSTDQEIAVEIETKQWVKASFVNKSPFNWMNFINYIPLLLVLMAAVAVAISMMPKKA